MKFWQVDAFTNKPFRGNPAAVFIFEEAPTDELMQNIAMEMNLSETAFVIKKPELTIRWFTPTVEVDLCGHATLAAAHIFLADSEESVLFQSMSGPLTVTRNTQGYTLDFPLQPSKPAEQEILDLQVLYAGTNGDDFMVEIEDGSKLATLTPDMDKICALSERGFLVSAKDPTGEYDYIYRAFFPKLGILEDPVTGSANTCLAPYWSKKLGKNPLKAKQVSQRGGELQLEVTGDRLLISGEAVTVVEGELHF